MQKPIKDIRISIQFEILTMTEPYPKASSIYEHEQNIDHWLMRIALLELKNIGIREDLFNPYRNLQQCEVNDRIISDLYDKVLISTRKVLAIRNGIDGLF